jgi:hypothetical protein
MVWPGSGIHYRVLVTLIHVKAQHPTQNLSTHLAGALAPLSVSDTSRVTYPSQTGPPGIVYF